MAMRTPALTRVTATSSPLIGWRTRRRARRRRGARTAGKVLAARGYRDDLRLDGVTYPGAGSGPPSAPSAFSVVVSASRRHQETLATIVEQSQCGLPVELECRPDRGQLRLWTAGGPIDLRLRASIGLPPQVGAGR